MACTHKETCPLFPLFSMKSTLQLWQLHYCDSKDYVKCDRYQRTARGERVPPTLLPDGTSLVLPKTAGR